MNKLFFLIILATPLFFTNCKTAQNITTVTTTSEPLQVMNADTLKDLKISIPMIPNALQNRAEKRIFGVKKSDSKTTTAIIGGTVVKKVYDATGDTLDIAALKEGVVIGFYTDKTLGVVLQVAFAGDGDLVNKKFLAFALNDDNDFQLVLEGDEGAEYISYEGQKFFVDQDADNSCLLLFRLKTEVEHGKGKKIAPAGRKVGQKIKN